MIMTLGFFILRERLELTMPPCPRSLARFLFSNPALSEMNYQNRCSRENPAPGAMARTLTLAGESG